MAKRKANDDAGNDKPAVKLYGAPPPLSDDLIRRLQGAVDMARRERTPQQSKRPINPFAETDSDVPPERDRD